MQPWAVNDVISCGGVSVRCVPGSAPLVLWQCLNLFVCQGLVMLWLATSTESLSFLRCGIKLENHLVPVLHVFLVWLYAQLVVHDPKRHWHCQRKRGNWGLDQTRFDQESSFTRYTVSRSFQWMIVRVSSVRCSPGKYYPFKQPLAPGTALYDLVQRHKESNNWLLSNEGRTGSPAE